MGVQPKVLTLRIPHSSNVAPRRLSKTKTFRHHPVSIELPDDVRVLKQKILETHPTKLTRFSLSHMRHLAIPPVHIPATLNDQRALSAVVSGKKVPLTMHMWENCKRKIKRMDVIYEYITYR
ncbi:hypothetical protein PsorP6_003168 [Peronosclerospora sorghi]|uniref:Uncharacterized protein n=1 Tax=Peronosclerospora sorghi TaxID=230839 RepID=A0ACC0VN22_9STRA|nr:hypothetical protein PsorP6_003168 [Peronosclerospora sorghi]